MNSFELTSFATVIANTIACRVSEDEIALIASIFVQIGDTLATIAANRALCAQSAEPPEKEKSR